MLKCTEARDDEASRLAVAISERLREVVPSAEFDVRIEGRTVGVVGVGKWRGNTWRTRPVAIWLLPLSATRRLRMIFESQGKELQEFLSRVRGQPWPSVDAESHVLVTDQAIHIWWGGADESDAVVRSQPI